MFETTISQRGGSATPHTETVSIKGRSFEIEIFDGGRGGFEATEQIEKKDGSGTFPVVHLLPPIYGRIQGSGEIQYVIPEQDGEEVMVVSGKEIDSQEAFIRRGVALEREAMQDRTLRNLWMRLIEKLTILQKPSPSIYEGTPFLTSKTVGPDLDGDEAKAKVHLAEIGRRLQPLGRWILGATLFSPWVKKVGGTNAVIHCVGGAGDGKSALTLSAAWLFGHASDNGRGLWTPFNSSSLGLQALSQNLSYYPLLLDETNNATGDIERILTDLVMGSNRQRANRNGTAQGARGSWEGLVVATGNDPLKLKHEMFSRRFIAIQAADLWNTPATGSHSWWGELFEGLEDNFGLVWAAVCEQYAPGTDAAKQMPRDFAKLRDRFDEGSLDKVDNLLTVALLGVFGCVWMARWTGEKIWIDGVWEAIRAIVDQRAAEKRDIKREVAEAILKDLEENPGAWGFSKDDRFEPARKAWDANGKLAPCGVDHGDEDCRWMDISSLTFNALTRELDPARIFGDADLLRAMTRGTNLDTRRVKHDGRQVRAYTLCLPALFEFADAAVTPNREAKSGAKIAAPALLEGDDAGDPDPAASAAPATTTDTTPEEEAMDFRTIKTPGTIEVDGKLTRNLEAINHALNRALEVGLANVIVPHDWSVDGLEDWESKSLGASTSFTVHRKDDDEKEIRIWKMARDSDPARYRAALLRMLDEDPNYTTGGGLALYWLRTPNARAKTPKWILDGDAAEMWADRSRLFGATTWGVSSKEREGMELTSYDRNKSYLPAIGSAIVAPLWFDESFSYYGEDAPIGKEHAGLYLVEIPEWPLALPSVYGNATPGETKWVDSSMLRFHEELRASGRYPELQAPIIVEAFLAPAHKVSGLQTLMEKNKELLARFDNTPEERNLAKGVYRSAAGAIGSPTAHRKVYRPDWEAAIKLTSWVNVLRAVYKEHEADERFVPVAINVDAVYYPADLPAPSTFRIGETPGQFKKVED